MTNADAPYQLFYANGVGAPAKALGLTRYTTEPETVAVRFRWTGSRQVWDEETLPLTLETRVFDRTVKSMVHFDPGTVLDAGVIVEITLRRPDRLHHGRVEKPDTPQ